MIFSKEMFGGADAAASLLEEPIAVIVKDINRKKYFMRSEAPARSRILPHQFGGSCTGFAGRGAAVAALLGLLCVIIDPRRGGRGTAAASEFSAVFGAGAGRRS